MTVDASETLRFLEQLSVLAASQKIEVVRDSARLVAEFSGDRSHHKPCTPLVAVLPNTVDDVASVVRLCTQHRVSMTPRGTGTGLEGGCIPTRSSCVIDTRNLKRFDLDHANSNVWVGAGWKKLEVVKRVREAGFHFGPDPASNPSVGGMCATGGSGLSTLKYGTTRENVLSLRVVTPDGSVVTTRAVVRKSSTGLDLTQLYCGSEGTLGIICEICFRLHPRLDFCSGGFVEFASTEAAVRSVVEIRKGSDLTTLVRCELLNKEAVIAANKEFGTKLAHRPTVLFELFDDNADFAHAEKDVAVLRAIFTRHGADRFEYIRDTKYLDEIWEARRGCLLAAGKVRGKRGEKVYNTDVCVPLSELARTVTETEADFASSGIPCIICAHIADGNFHCLIPYQTDDERRKVLDLEFRMVRRAIARGGTASGEHGVGVGKVKHLIAEHGADHIRVQESIKRALDPLNLMNPGVFYPSQVLGESSSHL